MTSTPDPSAPSTPSRRGPLIAVAAVAIVALAAVGLWYLFLRPEGPAPVSLGSSAPSASATAPATQSTEPATSSEPATSTEPVAGSGIEGTWTVDPSQGSLDDFSSAFVGYRVRETLANIGAKEAVGRTPDVTGSITVDGTTITAGEFTADLTTLQSDDDRRDGQLRQQALETGEFPNAIFVLTSPIELGSVPADGVAVDATATGDLTLHGVTRTVEIPLQARVDGGTVTIAGSLPILFADFGIDQPRSMMVLSVEDNGVMEVQLLLTRG